MLRQLKSKLRRAEYIILLIYIPLYIAFVLIAFFQGEFSQITGEIAGFLILFFVFLLVAALSFKWELLSGILFLVWIAGVIFVDLTLVEEDSGMGIISSIPILVVGILLIQRALAIREREKLKGSV
jgi:hypothetical protein